MLPLVVLFFTIVGEVYFIWRMNQGELVLFLTSKYLKKSYKSQISFIISNPRVDIEFCSFILLIQH
uniref:Uncharacterized protein n=1 Tax=Rhizophora mucronata TaxID=61149 RepID=A0A2P2J4M3_RHIMU